MKITLIQVGKTNEKYLEEGISNYVGRLTHYADFSVTTLPELKNAKSLSIEQQKEKDTETILKSLEPNDEIILLDEKGKEFTSTEFAGYMEKKMASTRKRIVFVIGGPFGFSQKIYDMAHDKISISRMTFSHQMIRLLFVEQLYRAFTIIKGEHYHHE